MIKNLISIIVANFNNDKYLERCLDSVINQTYKNIEVVVGDDCSTDSSRTILERYSKRYSFINVVYNITNVGVTQNRHNAILASKGEYITTLDADDFYYDKNKLLCEIQLIEKYQNNCNSEIIAYSNTAIVNEQGEFLKFWYDGNEIPEGDILEKIFTRSCVIPRDFVFLRKIYDCIGGYDCNIPLYEDYDLDIRLAKNYKFYYTGIAGTAYRQNTGGLSQAKLRKHYKWLLYIINKNRYLIQNSEVYKTYRKKIYKSLILYYIRKYKLSNKFYNYIKR